MKGTNEDLPNQNGLRSHEERVNEQKPFRKEMKDFNFGKIFLGIILVIVGLIYLVQATDLIPVEININIWQLWPLLIVALGLALLTGRSWVTIVLGSIATVIVLGIIGIVLFGNVDSEDGVSIEIRRSIPSWPLPARHVSGGSI